ncbi:MAG: SDR family NAD(P)-dependent oxidoreductase [Pseudomonadales bacterium]|nr:SDR family NAD(P)-dependent oxidoreductase [Pseudomonadales bacterium]
MKTYIITGATGGLGLSIARCLAKDLGNRIIIAVRDTARGQALATELGGNVEVAELDLGSLNCVDKFVESWKGEITGLINNAGVQIVNETRLTQYEQLEETFVVNHLAALKLTLGLIPFLKGGRVLFIGSGTHNPKNITANLFGFRGAKFESIAACAKGLDETGSIKQIGMDRYATSKFLNIVTTVELSRQLHKDQVAFFCLDPGMMAGTGLARTAPRILQVLWRHVLPWGAKILPDTSTPERSGKTAAWIMESKDLEGQSGVILSFDGRPSKKVWGKAFDAEIGKAVMDDSMGLLSALK